MSPEVTFLFALFMSLGLLCYAASRPVVWWMNRRERRRRLRQQRIDSGEAEDWLEQWRRLAGR